MENKYYSVDWTEEQKAFIMDNIKYLELEYHTHYGFNAYDYICFNKLHCEMGIYIDTDGKYKDIYIVLPKHRHFLKIGYAGETTYQEYLDNIKNELEKRNVTIEQLQLIQRYSNIAYYTRIEDWSMEKNKKIIFHVNDSYGKWAIIDFFLYLIDGVERANLKDANDIMDEYKITQGDTIDIKGFHVRTFYNGKVEVSMTDKKDFTPDFISRYNDFMAIMERAHKNCIWNTWESGY